ncbi:MAG: hypothetical protein GWP59_08395 [Chlamydiales bacterium]|nr:hypothetical protein [Chlamydiales bacterium]
MKFTCLPEHRDYYNKEGLILFEKIITEEKAKTLLADAKLSMKSRKLLDKRQKYHSSEAQERFYYGRNLWMDSPSFKSLAHSKTLHNLIQDLHNIKSTLLAFDQLYIAAKAFQPFQENFANTFCIKPILSSLIICLEPSTNIEADSFWSFEKLSGMIINPETKLPTAPKDGTYVILAFCQETAQYILNEHDINTHFLKHLGLSFGSSISSKHFPKVDHL